MAPALFLLLQAAASAQASPAEFDLGAMAQPEGRQSGADRTRGCITDDPTEIVVCGTRRNADRYRLGPLPLGFDPQPAKAETQLMKDVTGDLHAERAELANGMISKRVMIRVKIKF